MKNQEPWPVTGMRLTVLILALWNGLRLGAALLDWSTLAEFAPRPGPLYIAGTASFWTLACVAVAEFIRRRNARSQTGYALLLIGYIAWWWADRILFQQPLQNETFALVFSGIFLIDTIANYFNKTVRDYFMQRESHDQPSTNNPTA